MQQNPLAYDAAALKNRLILRHGTDVGELIFAAETNRRRIADEKSAALGTELAEVMQQLSALQADAGQDQMKRQAEIEAAYQPYLELLEAAAAADVQAQSEIAVLSAKSQSLQSEMRSIVTPRLNEAELQAVAIYNSASATLAREAAKIVPPPYVEPMSELARINFNGKTGRS
jgi:hypothetical protein